LPLVATSNVATETAARSGEIIAVCGVLSRTDFTCQEDAVDLNIDGELASPIGQGFRSLWANRKRSFCQHNCPQIQYESAFQFRWISNGDADLVSGVGTSIGCFQFVPI
jgi:hypothetical protein